jgi:transcriptional regulator
MRSVYIPKAFEETRPEVLHALIQQNSFGILVSQESGELVASHLPFLLEPERGPHGILVGHMARANPQWRSFREGEEVLAIFLGPHAYISPSWYEAELAVPTWNYAAVHAYGVPTLVEDGAALHRILDAMVRTYEASLTPPWALQLPDDYMARMMKGIVGFEIEITRIEGKLKLGQNRSPADQAGVVAALTRQADPLGLQIAELTKEQMGPQPSTLLPSHD